MTQTKNSRGTSENYGTYHVNSQTQLLRSINMLQLTAQVNVWQMNATVTLFMT